MKLTAKSIFFILIGAASTFYSCQNLERPSLASYPKDANPAGGPLKFYAAFDGTTTNVLMNAVDSIRANFPSTNPMTAIDGISGKGLQGDGTVFVTYPSPNDFGNTASSFTISFWEKQNGIPKGDAAFLFTIPSGNNKWGDYGFSMFALFDWSEPGGVLWTPVTEAIVKFYIVDDKTKTDNWFVWDGSTRVPGVQDNKWHHMAFVYDASMSTMTLYVDGVANVNVLKWGSHGAINIDNTKVQALNIGGNKSAKPGKDLGWGQQWPGGLDQFRMYATALSASEVQALFAGKK